MQKMWSGIRVILVAFATAVFVFVARPVLGENTAEATYKEKCTACHGADGKGETPAGKATKARDFGSEDVQKLTDEELTGIITNGKNKMPAYEKSLKPEQVKDLVAYIRNFKK